jgi:hypothetical protein
MILDGKDDGRYEGGEAISLLSLASNQRRKPKGYLHRLVSRHKAIGTL